MFNIDLSFFPNFGIELGVLSDLIVQFYFTESILKKFDYFLQLKLKNKKNINIYKTGRLLFQGSWEKEEILHLVDYLLSKTEVCDFDVCIGSDEAGKGESMGGLVVVAFAIRKENLSELITVGAVDSKRLKAKNLNKIAQEIRSIGEYIAVSLSSREFNTKWKQIGNLNSLLEEMHGNAILKLFKISTTKWQEAQKYAVFVDKFMSTQSSIRSYLNREDNLGLFLEYFEEHKAEKYPIVGAASILAKFFYEKALEKDNGLKDYKSVS